MQKFKLKFYINKEEDKKDTYEFFNKADPAGWQGRTLEFGIPLFLINDIVEDKQNAKEALFKHMDKEYEFFEKYKLYEQDKTDSEKFWNKIGSEFSERVFEITNKELNNHKCLLTLYITTAAWDDNLTIRRDIKNLSQDRFLIAFELLLSHTFKFVRDFYKEKDINSAWDVWGLAEITASFILRDERINKLFPELNFPLESNWFIRTNYPFLADYEDTLKDFWVKRSSFKEYIDKSVEYISNNHIQFG